MDSGVTKSTTTIYAFYNYSATTGWNLNRLDTRLDSGVTQPTIYDLRYYATEEILQWRLQSANYTIGRGAIASNYFVYFN